MTGEEAYHSDCFCCVSCKKKIEELVFTQTSKGIHCTPCHEKRKAEKRKRQEKRKQIDPSPPTPTHSRNNSTSTSITSSMPSFSFFENESTELTNLTKKLGANIDSADKITRASQYLESLIDFPEPPSQLKLQEVLEELGRARQEFAKEVSLRQEHEQELLQFRHQWELYFSAKKLSRNELEMISQQELIRMSKVRADLEKTCRDLKAYRDGLLSEISAGSDWVTSTEIKSLLSERDHLRQDIQSLESVRDDVLNEMVMLNTKNAQLTEINNDLSRRLSAQSERKSSEVIRTGFRLKKNMFSKLKKSTAQEKHQFQPTNFLRPTKCDGCGETLWGLAELRCTICLCASHARCLPQVSASCAVESLFGQDLGARAQFEERMVPIIVVQCIDAVERRGMCHEGIYRKSGGAAQMKLIQQSFETGVPLDLEDEEAVNDIASVTSILKLYFRELPVPLLTFTLYPKLIQAVSINDAKEKSDKFFELLSQLPQVNYDTLELTIKHLHSVQENHTDNLMTTKNLAMVFGPTLMRDEDGSRELADMSYKNAVIEYLITHAHSLFT